ncbi:MAG: Crp/Fnr family transcriptional regulator [Erysipelotrichaceae bacterium]|nr:Crp/Fnr family transcriptional regulator [Erysipelotrichaceae bacterium]MBQ1624819.1 Crp/Fnr family transcriptional regulator [Erysipelotrichaceae bacterium]MBQ1811368.1 Crp/Fnr family transcriptional regulator [Erysipelotrichaceae bacterium]MBQ2078234.1 Crp/Fnr family transcriptional regulator [Erysipelotrichaceae bacterium]MBQ3962860.1 Crp/Fnr family transcriptional regulator [Erysipelotrichaceae bacterium]
MNIIALLNEKEKERLIYKELRKGETLFYENDCCEEIGIVKYGKLLITSYPENGNPIIYNRLKEDDMFGNNLLFSSQPFYKGDVIAESDSGIILIKKDVLIGFLEENTDFLLAYLQIQADSGKRLHSRIRLLSIDSAQERFITYLRENGNKITYSSVSDLADDLFIRRETLSRLLSKLIKNKVVIKDGKTVRLL